MVAKYAEKVSKLKETIRYECADETRMEADVRANKLFHATSSPVRLRNRYAITTSSRLLPSLAYHATYAA